MARRSGSRRQYAMPIEQIVTQRNYYEILGIPSSASPQQIRAAHRAMSRKFHPDTADDGNGDPRAFAHVQVAYESLCNSDVRRRYDHKQGTARTNGSPSSRRPRKNPCVVCSRPVYASQLKLHLGRHMCMLCFQQRKTRGGSRVRISATHEISWQLKRLRFWAQSHLPLIAVIALALGAVGMRLVWVVGQNHDKDAPAMHDSTSGKNNTASTSQSNKVQPCTTPPDSTETADVR
jgi:hypothetical protein